ncbi:MAG TPA: hypothetical protein VJN18_01900 [Polyangiaceae bacterium]|nr:hypothetical protein [Polyangiaceae bacterium]
MIYKSALIAAAVLALVAVVTGKTIRSQRMITLNGLKYEVTRYSNDTMHVAREDGLRFSLDAKSGAIQLHAGSPAQLDDATTRIRANFLAELGGGFA